MIGGRCQTLARGLLRGKRRKHRPSHLPVLGLIGVAVLLGEAVQALEPLDYCLQPLEEAPELAVRDWGSFDVLPQDYPAVEGAGSSLRLIERATGETVAWMRSPAGDFPSALAFDPTHERVYVGSNLELAWVDLVPGRGPDGQDVWAFGANGPVSTILFDPRDRDLDRLGPVSYSAALGLTVHSGVEVSFFRRPQAYRFVVLDGSDARDVPEAAVLELRYAADDPLVGMAVLVAPGDGLYWEADRYWFDGERIITPTEDEIGPFFTVSEDPFGQGEIVLDRLGQLHHWDGEELSALAPGDGAVTFSLRRPTYRPHLDRWVFQTREAAYEYVGPAPLRPVEAPPLAYYYAWFDPSFDGAGGWLAAYEALLWEHETSVETVAAAPEGWVLAGPAHTAPLADGTGFAVNVVNRDIGASHWYRLTVDQTGRCLAPDDLFEHAAARAVP